MNIAFGLSLQSHINSMEDSPYFNGVSEPPSFPTSQPELRALDAAVVCQICKELYVGPVVMQCGHSFCSKCIRGSLQSMKACPVCNEPAKEGDIRRNRALEEIAISWERARSSLITLTATRRSTFSSYNAVASSSKRLPSDSPQRTDSPRRSTSPRKRAKKEENDVIVVDSSDAEDTPEIQEVQGELGDDDLTNCPLCSVKLPVSAIPGHIERGCKDPISSRKKVGGKASSASWKDLFAGSASTKHKPEMKRILKPNMSMATPAELRAILGEYGLATQGDKPALQWRVSEWILLFNSNLDTDHPKSIQVLRTALADHEAAAKRDKERGKVDAVDELASSEALKQYALAQKELFRKHHVAAMKSAKAAKKAKRWSKGSDKAAETSAGTEQ